MSQQQPQKFDYQLFTRVIALAKPYKGIFITAGILAVVLAPLSTLRPIFQNSNYQQQLLKRLEKVIIQLL